MFHIIILIVNFSQDYYIIIDRGVSEFGLGRELVDGLNSTEKDFYFS